jgi:hypothetical protein
MIGDAAHAALPTVGGGASTALEDAVCLGRLVARFGADLGGGWRQPVRNAVLRLTPPRLMVRAGTPVVNWTAPGQ